MQVFYLVVVVYLLLVNLIGFLLMGIDKSRARHGRWRISEATLVMIAFLGGSIGAILGMWIFHHKTRHWYFRYGLPLILLAQLAAALVCGCFT